jgi:hypothetical protein
MKVPIQKKTKANTRRIVPTIELHLRQGEMRTAGESCPRLSLNCRREEPGHHGESFTGAKAQLVDTGTLPVLSYGGSLESNGDAAVGAPTLSGRQC